MSKPAALNAQSTVEEDHDLLRRQSMEGVNLCTGQQRGDDLKGRIFRCRPNQDHVATFHVRQKGILLRLIEPVNFIHKQYGPLAELPGLFSIGHDGLDFLDTAQYSAKRDEV